MRSFQIKLLRTETSGANEDSKRYEEMLRKGRSLVQKVIDERRLASIFRYVRHQISWLVSIFRFVRRQHQKTIAKH